MSNATSRLDSAEPIEPPQPAEPARPERLLLVFNGDSGAIAMLADVLKKAMGREDCALCEMVYSPVGKRAAWVRCAARLALPIKELHRDELPADWQITANQLPCILAQNGSGRPTMLVSRETISACGGRLDRLEREIETALSACR